MMMSGRARGAAVLTLAGLMLAVAGCGPARTQAAAESGSAHQWPGSVPPSRLAARLLNLDQPSTALNATQVIWRFFASHHLAAHPR